MYIIENIIANLIQMLQRNNYYNYYNSYKTFKNNKFLILITKCSDSFSLLLKGVIAFVAIVLNFSLKNKVNFNVKNNN